MREPDKRDGSHTERGEKTNHSAGYLYQNEGSLEEGALWPAVEMHDHRFLLDTTKDQYK